jgi:hypothetical protein
VFLAGFRLTYDFRTGMILQVVVLSALAFGLMRFAARLRGRPDWPDAFFPVSLLHTGHWENFLLGYQICFVLFCVFVTGLVVVALRTTRETAYSSGIQAGVLLLCAAMTGGSGLALIPPVGAWLLYLAFIVRKNGNGRRALVLVALAALAVAYLALYFVGYQRPANHAPPSTDPVAIIRVASEVLSMALGAGVAVSGAWPAVFAAELVLGIATVVLLVRRAKDAALRPAVVGLIAVAAGVCGVAVAVGIGRADLGGLWSRYAMQSWPLLGAAYLAWLKFGSGSPEKGSRKWVPVVMCMAATVAFLPNTGVGMSVAVDAQRRNTSMEADAKGGAPPEGFVRKHFPESRDAGQEDRGIRYIPLLRDANVGIFATGEPSGVSPWWVVWSALLIGLGVRWCWHLGRAVQAERARELFRLQHERYEEQFLKAAAATGLPRGLKWVGCKITGDAVLVRDLNTSGIVALVPVLIQFEPEEGSEMAENPAAREPRPATAVFTFQRGTWETVGRVVFNHTPEQTVARFAPQFRVIHHGHH